MHATNMHHISSITAPSPFYADPFFSLIKIKPKSTNDFGSCKRHKTASEKTNVCGEMIHRGALQLRKHAQQRVHRVKRRHDALHAILNRPAVDSIIFVHVRLPSCPLGAVEAAQR